MVNESLLMNFLVTLKLEAHNMNNEIPRSNKTIAIKLL